MSYKTKVTWLGKEYGCRVFFNNKLIVEGRCKTRLLIGPTFRDLLRTIDSLNGDKFTNAARKRKYKPGNIELSVKHYWN